MRGFSKEVAPHYSTFTAYGVLCEARASSEEILERLEPLLPPLRQKAASTDDAHHFGIVEDEDGSHSVYNGTVQVTTQAPLDLALVMCENQIRSWVALNAPGLIFVHAGVVEHEGKAIVMPGDSFAGKTTLVAELVKRGATYFSDEFAAFDHDGRVHPYPKQLSIRSHDGLTEAEHTVESIGGLAADRPLPLGVVVSTYYVPGAEWRPRTLSKGEATLSLFGKTVAARERPEEAMKVLANAVEGVTVIEGERGEAAEFAEMLLSGGVRA
jgi:hypothetical protein